MSNFLDLVGSDEDADEPGQVLREPDLVDFDLPETFALLERPEVAVAGLEEEAPLLELAAGVLKAVLRRPVLVGGPSLIDDPA